VIYKTERLDVRPWTADPADVDRVFDIYSRWEVARWLGAEPRPLADRAVEHAFAAGIPEVYAVVRPGNEASMAVCRRLGMSALGLSTRWYGVEVEAFRLAAPDRGE
jgi:RimJ/RimL family protein N-acetyltransferase